MVLTITPKQSEEGLDLRDTELTLSAHSEEAEQYVQYLQGKEREQAYYTAISISTGGNSAKIDGLQLGEGLDKALQASKAKHSIRLVMFPRLQEFVHALTAKKQKIQDTYLKCVSAKAWIVWERDRKEYLEEFFALKAEADDMREVLLEEYESAQLEFELHCRNIVIGNVFDSHLAAIGEDAMKLLLNQACDELEYPHGDTSLEVMYKVLENVGLSQQVDAKASALSLQFIPKRVIEEEFYVAIESPRRVPNPQEEREELQRKALELELQVAQHSAMSKLRGELDKLSSEASEMMSNPNFGKRQIEALNKRVAELKERAETVSKALQTEVGNVLEVLEGIESKVNQPKEEA